MKKLVPIIAITLMLALTACDDLTDTRHGHGHRDPDYTTEAIVDTPTSTPAPTPVPTEEVDDGPIAQASPAYEIVDYATGDTYSIDLLRNVMYINSVRYPITAEKSEELASYLEDYTRVVYDGQDDYWPNTEEYPDMERLFSYTVIGERRDNYSGGLCYPDGWVDMKAYICSYTILED